MWTLGKTAALAASARIAATQHERTRLLAERVDLAREVHERVMQRLFGVSLVLGAETELAPDERRRCADEIQAAVADLRHALARPVAPPRPDTGATLRQELERLGSSYDGPPLDVEWDPGRRGAGPSSSSCRSRCSPRRFATPTSTPSRPASAYASAPRTAPSCSRWSTTGSMRRRRGHGAGMGLRLAALDALQSGGVVDFGPGDERQRLARAARRPARSGGRMTDYPMDRRRLRVLIVDDHEVVHWGFRLLLTEQPWVERCLTARNGEEGRELARRYEPHVALVDLFVGEESGAEMCEALRRESPTTRVLLISGAGWISPQAAKAAGASGFVSKDWGADEVAAAVRAVGNGRTVFAAAKEQPHAPLSPRERDVLGAARHRRHQPRDRRSAPPLAAHRQGAHQQRLPQARGPQPRRGRPARGASRLDHVTAGARDRLLACCSPSTSATPRPMSGSSATRSCSSTGASTPSRTATADELAVVLGGLLRLRENSLRDVDAIVVSCVVPNLAQEYDEVRRRYLGGGGALVGPELQDGDADPHRRPARARRRPARQRDRRLRRSAAARASPSTSARRSTTTSCRPAVSTSAA